MNLLEAMGGLDGGGRLVGNEPLRDHGDLNGGGR